MKRKVLMKKMKTKFADGRQAPCKPPSKRRSGSRMVGDITFERDLLHRLTYHFLYAVSEVLVQDLSCHLEHSFYILPSLSGSLEEKWDLVPLLEFSCLLHWHFSLLLTVFHVAYENHDHVRFALLDDFFVPSLQTFESAPPRDIVGEQDAVGPLVENLRYRLKRLLARRVPDLQLEKLLFKTDHEGAEFDPDRHLVVHDKLVLRDSVHKTALANCRIPNDDHLKETGMLA